MTHYFKLPQDLYFWGQDRVGSLIPLLGQVPFKLFNCSALLSEAIVHYFILLLGFLSFASFLKSYFLRVVFAIIWFFPPMRLIDVTQLPFGIHYSLIAIAIYLFNFYNREKIQNNLIFRHLILSTITIILIASVWVSDMAMISVFLLLTIQVYFYLIKNKFSILVLRKLELYHAIVGGLLGYFFISYAKSNAPNKTDYTTFSDFETISKTIKIFNKTILDFFKFEANEPFTSVYAYLSVIFIVAIITQIRKLTLSETAKKWLLFFLIESLILFVIIIISNWTFLNGVPRRYFTCTYITLAFALVLVLDNLKLSYFKIKVMNSLLLSLVCIGGIGALYNIKFIWPKTMKPRAEFVREFEQLGQIGIIAEYWNSYIASCTNPDLIKATPHDLTWNIKSEELVNEVFKQENIYVIRDMWLESYPDTLSQFGRVLLKDGNEFKLGDCNVCKYKKIMQN
jgi:hypothetical protein